MATLTLIITEMWSVAANSPSAALDISEIQTSLDGITPLTPSGSPVLSLAPTSGVAANLQDDDELTSVRWASSAGRPGMSIEISFTVANDFDLTTDPLYFRYGAGPDADEAMLAAHITAYVFGGDHPIGPVLANRGELFDIAVYPEDFSAWFILPFWYANGMDTPSLFRYEDNFEVTLDVAKEADQSYYDSATLATAIITSFGTSWSFSENNADYPVYRIPVCLLDGPKGNILSKGWLTQHRFNDDVYPVRVHMEGGLGDVAWEVGHALSNRLATWDYMNGVVGIRVDYAHPYPFMLHSAPLMVPAEASAVSVVYTEDFGNLDYGAITLPDPSLARHVIIITVVNKTAVVARAVRVLPHSDVEAEVTWVGGVEPTFDTDATRLVVTATPYDPGVFDTSVKRGWYLTWVLLDDTGGGGGG